MHVCWTAAASSENLTFLVRRRRRGALGARVREELLRRRADVSTVGRAEGAAHRLLRGPAQDIPPYMQDPCRAGAG